MCVCERIYFQCQALFLYFVIWARDCCCCVGDTHIHRTIHP